MEIHTQKVEDLIFFVAAVTSGIDADGGELASGAPALDGERRDTQNGSHFTDGE